MRYLLGCIVCVVGWGQTAFIPTAQLCPSGQIGSYTVTGVIGTLSLIKFTCITPPTAPTTPTVLTNKNVYIMANCTPVSITGTGNQSTFTIPSQPPGFAMIVFKNGIPLSAASDYLVTGNSISFTAIPLTTDSISIFSTILIAP